MFVQAKDNLLVTLSIMIHAYYLQQYAHNSKTFLKMSSIHSCSITCSAANKTLLKPEYSTFIF